MLRRYSSYLTELDGTSKADVWAAGTTYSSFGSRLLVLHWDGSGWSRVVTPVVPTDPFTNVRVTGLAVADVDDVWLLGHSIVSSKTVNFALHWDGAAWASVSFPDLGGAELEGIAADGVGGVWVVGPNVIGGRPGVVLRWDGVSWQNLSIVSGYTYTKLFFVSAGPSGPVVTGFGRNFGSDETVPLILRRVSGGWLEIPTDIGSLSSGGPIDITSTGHLFALVHGASEPSALVGCGF